MKPERTTFEGWLARLPFLLRCLVLSVMMLSGAGMVIAIRVVAGQISRDLTGLVPAVLLVLVVAVLSAWRAGRKF